MKKVTMQKLLRITAVLIFIIGAGIGYDMGGQADRRERISF